MPDTNIIPVTRSSMPPLDEYVEEIAPLWESHWLTNMGEKHAEFENRLKDYLNVENICLYTNGHSALECALEALQLQGKVITTPYSFASTTHAIVRKGLTPVFADIKPEDCTINPDEIEKLIDADTCAIVPVHVYGNLCDVDAIQEIALKHNLKVVYDAAHAFGVEKDGKSAASFGDMSMFSFHAAKVFNTIEGGALCFADPNLKPVLDQWKNFGITSPETVEYIGGNAKMNEFCAAMGICNLRHLPDEISKREAIAKRYWSNLDNIEGIRLFKPPAGIKSNYSYMPVLFERPFRINRNEVFGLLDKEGIKTRKYFYPLISEYDCYSGKFDSSQTPVAKHVSDHILTLPMYADLSLPDVDRICDIIIAGNN